VTPLSVAIFLIGNAFIVFKAPGVGNLAFSTVFAAVRLLIFFTDRPVTLPYSVLTIRSGAIVHTSQLTFANVVVGSKTFAEQSQYISDWVAWAQRKGQAKPITN
jgi:hypothetical protein